MNSPRIAYICADPGVPVFGRKGCSIHVQEVVRALRRRGAAVELFAARFEGPAPADLQDVVTHALPCARGGELAERERAALNANAALANQLTAAGPFDCVYERYSLWSHAGMTWARAQRVPGLLEVNAPLVEEQAAHRGLVDVAAARDSARWTFMAASALLAVSDEVASYLQAKGVDAERVRVISNGVDPLRFAVAAECPGERAEAGPFTVGFVGTLKPWHGLQGLIEAFARLRGQVPDARLLIVGEGPEREASERRLAELGLMAVTTFTGALPAAEVPAWIAQMDVAVAPYPQLADFYFSPLKVFEYMTAARAVVASRVGQLTWLIRHDENGLHCAPGDIEDLTRQLLRLHASPALRRRLGLAARQTILAGHTWDHVAGRILQLIEPNVDPRAAAPTPIACS
jgi:glycosyltransferase involved in cell wall biosynthesis